MTNVVNFKPKIGEGVVEGSVRYCKDCRWVVPFTAAATRSDRLRLAKCSAPYHLELTGAAGTEFADTSRKFGPCGKEGTMFEQRPSSPPTRWQRLLKWLGVAK